MTASLTATDARRQLFPLIKKVNDDADHVEIVSKHGSAVLVSKDEWDSMIETAYLLRSPANAARLMDSVADVTAGRNLRTVDLDDLDGE